MSQSIQYPPLALLALHQHHVAFFVQQLSHHHVFLLMHRLVFWHFLHEQDPFDFRLQGRREELVNQLIIPILTNFYNTYVSSSDLPFFFTLLANPYCFVNDGFTERNRLFKIKTCIFRVPGGVH